MSINLVNIRVPRFDMDVATFFQQVGCYLECFPYNKTTQIFAGYGFYECCFLDLRQD